VTDGTRAPKEDRLSQAGEESNIRYEGSCEETAR
jgi:hypothetical protein